MYSMWISIPLSVQNRTSRRGRSKVRIERDRFCVELVGGKDIRVTFGVASLAFARSQIKQPSLWILCGFGRPLIVRQDFSLQLACNRLGDLALDGKDVGDVAIISLRPQVSVGAGIDELRIYTHLAAG